MLRHVKQEVNARRVREAPEVIRSLPRSPPLQQLSHLVERQVRRHDVDGLRLPHALKQRVPAVLRRNTGTGANDGGCCAIPSTYPARTNGVRYDSVEVVVDLIRNRDEWLGWARVRRECREHG